MERKLKDAVLLVGVSLCSPGCPWTSSECPKLVLNPRASCLSFPNAGIMGVCHRTLQDISKSLFRLKAI